MPLSGTGERVTPALGFPSRDGLPVEAIRVDCGPGGFARGTPGHVDESFYEPPGAPRSVSRDAGGDVPASLTRSSRSATVRARPSMTVSAERPASMRVVRLRAPGGPGQLAVEEARRPRPGPGEALVRVHAAAITRDELQWPVDRLPAIPSYELAGVVEETGPGVEAVGPGDEVFALTSFDRDGVAAEYVAVPAELLAAKPRSFSRAESAATPLPALTAWQGLFHHGWLAAGERVLIHGAAGAVGGLAIQLARTRDAYVIGTAAAGELGLVRELGAHEAVDAATRFEDAVGPVDLVFDTVGGERLRRSGAVLRPGGRLVSVAEEPPDGGEYFTVKPDRDQLRAIARLADAGELRRPSVEIFPLASAREAFARTLARGRRGKVVLAVS